MKRRRWPGLAAVLLVGVAAAQQGHELQGPTMGSTWRLKWHGGGSPAQVGPLVTGLLEQVDQTFSNWRADSEIAAFNAHVGGAPFAASELLVAAVRQALALAVATQGAFDPTVKPLVDLYRASKATGKAPSAAELAAAQARVGYRALHVAEGSLLKDRADVAIDLDGLVAGLAADRLADRLLAAGVRDFMLEITGEVLCRGRRPDGQPWRIGIVDPERSTPGGEQPVLAVPVADRALCTSGDYRNFAIVEGGIVTHVFDPRTGRNPAHGVVSVSVLARSCALADGLGTALMVLGPAAAAAALAQSGEPDAGAWFLLADDRGTLRSVAVGWPEAFALDGRPLRRPESEPPVLGERERDLAAARAVQREQGDSVEAIVWVGRRLAYLGRFRAAIDEFTRGLELHPDEPHLLRHRGHRLLTVREFAAARRDFERAKAVARDLPLEVEPDGQPTPGRPPHSTLQGNIDYHLGLACFLLGDFAAAAAAWQDCLARAGNDEARVSAAHWLWCARTRLGDADGAKAAVAALGGELDVVENRSYWQLCRVYRGELDPASLAASAGSKGAVIAFGLAHLQLVRGQGDAMASLHAVAARSDWTSFGVLAAEAECARAVQAR